MQVRNFHPMPFMEGRLPAGIENFTLSVDEEYLYNISTAVSSGHCSKSLENKMPGPLHHARWLTKASRVLRLYIATESPSIKLCNIVKYVMFVYVPMYFEIKFFNSCTYGSKHFFNIIQYSKCLEPFMFEVVKRVCEHNFFFAHSENLLLCMIFDEDPTTRQIAFKRILQIRKTTDYCETVREYRAPLINFDAEKYYELIDWDFYSSEPPYTRNMPNEIIEDLVKSCAPIIDNEIKKTPCHIQQTERHIKIVSEVAQSAATKERREGIIATKILARKRRVGNDSVQDYVLDSKKS